MIKVGKWIVKRRAIILILSVALLIPSVLGIINTRVNYDMLDYLPSDIKTVEGQDILLDDFGKGAFSIIIIEDMESKDVSKLIDSIKDVDNVDSVIGYNSIADITIPMEMIPKDFYEIFNNGDSTMIAVFFDTSTSADETIEAIENIRRIAGKKCFVSGMSAMVTDIKNLCEQEEPIYVAIAVVLACIIMMIFMESWILPLIFIASIGMAILFNLGTNYFFGEISYITKALSAVLQLAVTMDYSIFLWHSYSEQKIRFDNDKERAMAHAISNTFTSVLGSSITTIAGFIALCFMSFTLGKDLGFVMAKGVVFGVIGCITILPSMILILDKAIEKTKHKPLMPNVNSFAGKIIKRPIIFTLIFLVIAIPAFYGYSNTEMYYDLGNTLPKDIDYVIANSKLQDDFKMGSVHMLLTNSNMDSKDTKKMLDEIDDVDGVKFTLGFNSLVGSTVPKEIIPESITGILESDRYQLILVSSEYLSASDEVNDQITEINKIIEKYDKDAMLIGEAPCTKDLIDITDKDFKLVNAISIIAIFIIIALVLKSISLPIILVALIEVAIFINLGIPYYSSVTLPFIAPICISTIQLGATVDYAILLTSRYKKERYRGAAKYESIKTALATSIPSIIVSALGFFFATIGLNIYSNIDIISSLCLLMARGAIISMIFVIFILPSLFMLLDKVIIKTSIGFINKQGQSTIQTEEQNGK